MPDDRFASQRQFLVRFDGIDGLFATAEGSGKTSDVSREFDGGAVDGEVMTGPAIPKNLRVSRGFRPVRDSAVLARADRECGTWRTMATIQPTDRDLVPRGRARRAAVVLVDYDAPAVDVNSGETARLNMDWAVERVLPS